MRSTSRSDCSGNPCTARISRATIYRVRAGEIGPGWVARSPRTEPSSLLKFGVAGASRTRCFDDGLLKSHTDSLSPPWADWFINYNPSERLGGSRSHSRPQLDALWVSVMVHLRLSLPDIALSINKRRTTERNQFTTRSVVALLFRNRLQECSLALSLSSCFALMSDILRGHMLSFPELALAPPPPAPPAPPQQPLIDRLSHGGELFRALDAVPGSFLCSTVDIGSTEPSSTGAL